MGRKFLSELNRASPILMKMGYWDIVLSAWAVFAVFAILPISMARSKNIGKGKDPSSSIAGCEETESRHLADHKEGKGKAKRFVF